MLNNILWDIQKRKQWKIIMRAHPRYTPREMLELYCPDIEVEDGRISVEESILSANMVCAKMSTILLQAYMNDVITVINDITDSTLYSGLKERDFLMANKASMRLSELLK